MKIEIVGAGQIGATLTRRLTALGHEVSVANSRGPATLTELSKETGARAVTVREAARAGDGTERWRGDRYRELLPKEAGMTESRRVEGQLGWPVVKTFNNIYTKHLREFGGPAGSSHHIAVPVGDDRKGKSVVLRLVDELGFDGVDAGGLDESWRQQPGTPVYTADLDATVYGERSQPRNPRAGVDGNVHRSLVRHLGMRRHNGNH